MRFVLTVDCLGLHLTPDGYRVLYDALMDAISKTGPDLLPERLPMVLPDWKDVEAWKEFDTASGFEEDINQ